MIKSFTKYILTLITLLCLTINAWAADCTYSLENTPSRVNVVETGKSWLGTKHYNFPNTTLCTLTNSYGISKISFNMKKDGGTNNGDFKLQFYNGSSWEDAKDASNNSITWNVKNSNTATVSREINPNSTTGKASKFQIIRTEDTNFSLSSRYFTISNIVVVMEKTLSGSEETMPFDNQVYNTTSSAKTRDFTFSNVATGKSISITNNTNATEFPAEIAKNGDCTGSVTVSVKFKPSQKGTRTGQITISGDCGSKTFTVTGNGLLATPTLTLKGTTGLVDRTADVTKPNYIDLGVFFDTYIGDGYKYEVVSSNSQYAHFVGDNFYGTEKGEYTIHITSPAGDHYSDTFADGKKYREIVITVRDKARPAYKMNYPQSSADAMLVDGTIENAFTLTNVSNDAYFACNISVTSISNVNDGSGKVISYDAKNNKIIAHNAGTATLQFVQTENNDYYGEESPKYTFTVSKHQTSFSGEAYSMMVDGTQIANYSYTNTSASKPSASNSDSFYYTIDEVQFINEELNKGTDLIIFNPSTKQITACNAGTAKITLHQKETYKYTGATASYNVTVNKYTPTFTWNRNNTPYYYGTSIPNIFSTTNPDCQYTIVSDNEYVAKVIGNTLHIYNVEETANITVTQAENYKWNGKTGTCTITPVSQNNHVTFTINSENYYTVFRYDNTGNLSWKNDGVLLGSPDVWSESGNSDDRYYDIVFTGIPDKLSFDYERSTSIATDCDWYVKESVDGVTWSEKNVWEKGNSNSGSVEVSLNKTTRYLRFCYSGNYGGYFRNIKVTEFVKFEATPKPLDFGTQNVTLGEQVKPVIFEHANAGRETKVTIEGADTAYFSVSPTTISKTGRDLYGTTYLDVTFDNGTTVRGDQPYTATLVIEDNTGHREEVQLTGVRYGKATPEFTWNPNNFPYYFNTSIANIVVSSNTDYANCPLTITSSNENIAKEENGRLYIYDQSGEVTFTVTQRGNDRYNEHTESFTFTPKAKPDLEVPFQVTQPIYGQAITVGNNCSWDGDDHHLKLGDGAWDDTQKTAILVFSGRPDKLTFSYATSYNLAVIEIGSFDNPKWEVEESSDGENWKSLWSVRTNSTSWADAEIPLSETTQYVRFSYDGNYAGYFKNINISELVGYKYLRAADGHYLSRGAKWGTQAVVDAFGVVSRLSRYTHDNENIYTRFFFVDNEQYMFETETEDEQRLHEVFTDHGTALNTNHLWQINDNGGIFTIQSANEVGEVSHKGNYITAVNGILAFTTNESEATRWQMEDFTEHPQYITDMLNRQAAEAALRDFGNEINTLEKVRNRLREEDFEVHEITIPALTLGEQTGESRTVDGMPHIYEQTITGLDTGFYRLTIKALYRISNSEIAWKCHQEKGKESVLACAYANNVQYPIQSVYASYHSSAIENTDELYNGKYYSTTLSSAAIAFNDANRYLNDVYVYVEADPGKTTGTLRYGIKSPSYVPGAWLAYSTITLTHFARKEYIFEGIDPEKPTDWHTGGNWDRGSVPNQYHNVRINANAIISMPVNVYGVTIDEDRCVNITSKGGLTVGNGGIVGAEENSITLDNTPEGAGFLRINPYAANKPQTVKVNYKTRTFNNGSPGNEVWQYIGMPGSDGKVDDLTGVTMYHWDETKGWIYQTENDVKSISAWEGFAFTQSKEQEATFQINVTPIFDVEKEIDLTCTTTGSGMHGDNLFVNSYLAPIDVTQIDENDIIDPEGNLTRTFFIFNSGSWNNWNNGKGDITANDYDKSSPGHYYSIPIHSAKFINDGVTQVVIPSMQGVYVYSSGEATIKLNYQKHVMAASATKDAPGNLNTPLRAPQSEVESAFQRVRIQATSQNSGADRLYIIQEPTTTKGYDNGYDGDNIMANGQVNIYTNEPFGQMEVSCSNNMDSMWIGFAAGEDTVYTLHFGALVGEDIYIKDISNDSVMQLTDGGQYTFYAQPNSQNDMRFQLLLNLDLPTDEPEQEEGGVTTNIEDATTTQLWMNAKHLYIAHAQPNSQLEIYNASGMLMTAPHTLHATPCTINLSHLPTGVYVLRINNKAYKFVCE